MNCTEEGFAKDSMRQAAVKCIPGKLGQHKGSSVKLLAVIPVSQKDTEQSARWPVEKLRGCSGFQSRSISNEDSHRSGG